MSKLSRKEARSRRHRRIRRKISGTSTCPRLAVCRTANHIHVQVIDDTTQRTLVSASTTEAQFRESRQHPNMTGAALLGKMLAERALAAEIRKVVFDRSGFAYHGRVKAVADAARAAGMEF